MEPSGNICSSCKQPLSADTPLGGLCPACLVKAGFYSGTAPEPEKPLKFAAPAVGELAPHFPQLEILELIGRGGMGALYKARQPKLNRQLARHVGGRWVWRPGPQNEEAIDLLTTMSYDDDHQVRSDVVYFGLSTVQQMDERVLRRLLELAMQDREPNMYQRIAWGLRKHRDDAHRVLIDIKGSGDQAKAVAAREIYRDMVGKPLDVTNDPTNSTVDSTTTVP